MGACAGDDDGNAATDVVLIEDLQDVGAAADLSATDLFGGDGSTPADASQDATIEPGAFLSPCQGNSDCLSGYCVEGEEGYFCTQVCTLNCPGGFDCRSVVIGSGDPVFLCLPRIRRTCTPCQADYQCPSGACLDLTDGRRCAPTCEVAGDCADGYECAADPGGIREGSYCQPRSGGCDCTSESEGNLRTCIVDNSLGACPGVETCDPEAGWVGCNAREPAAEVCDGLDNNCNALIDEGFDVPQPCENSVEGVGSCGGLRVCAGAGGLICNARIPAAEACDFIDNDCDGTTDEDFKAADGAWTRNGHCGTCNNNCEGRIANGTATCSAEAAGQPVCVVDTCNTDYIPIGRFQCGLPPDVSCQPCVGDAECYGGTCADVDGQRVCVSPCGAAAEACQPGYACGDLGGARRCLPTTGSCVCNARTDGQRRTCNENNDFGVCFGQEVCSGTAGWSGCTARAPAAEVCNGVDDDCNGSVDDGVTPPTEPCARTVAGTGTCTGTWFCNNAGDAVAWQCNAPNPSADICDFLDNDCSGTADTPFRDAAGRYVDDENCGSCGISCDGAIPNATAQCAVAAGRARCQVATCDAGFYAAGPLTCLPVGENLCAPCASDANCQTPGDLCISGADGSYCGRDCGAGNARGLPAGQCPEGFSCEDVGPSMQCLPTSGSCSCLPDDAGHTRSCLNSNMVGTCYGEQLCVANNGWTNCTAAVPAVETCNGRDDDCNGPADDLSGRGDACENRNNAGVCPGVRGCSAQSPQLSCVGQIPASETCNYSDDDCNGTVDDGFTGLFGSCSTGVGACLRYGFVECKADGSGTRCNAVAAAAGQELCNGVDDDCDGVVDDTADGRWDARGAPCFDGLGVCQVTGINVCTTNGSALTCSAVAPAPTSGELCNGLDDDCDGSVDEIFEDKGAVCSAGVGLCQRFGTKICADGGTALACSVQPGPALTEICDLLDNNCDGQTDESFKQNGVYVGDTTCGNCFTNCRTIYASAANGYGVCGTGGGSPSCALKCCKPGDALCAGNGDFYNLNEIPNDGCEFELDPNAIYVSESAGTDDTTCGVGPAATGSNRHPCRSILYGQGRATATSKTRLLVAGGAYYGNLVLQQGVSLLGGYNPLTWTRAPASNLTSIFGTQTAGHRMTVSAAGIKTTATEFSGFVVYGQIASGTSENSYAFLVTDSNSRLTIRDNIFWPGRGGPGAVGSTGTAGTAGTSGANGRAARELANVNCYEQCDVNDVNLGGAAGANSTCGSNTAGGKGGSSLCPDYNINSNLCTATDMTFAQNNNNGGLAGGGSAGGAAGGGGCASAIDPSGTSCNCRQPGATGCPTGTFGSDGGNGGSGAAGGAGTAAGNAAGSVASGHWQGVVGNSGAAGGNGSGGGGGGAGGGVETYGGCTNSATTDLGGSGGGGGAGGCGGAGGGGGGGAGGAFGLFINLTSQTSAPSLASNVVHQGVGGIGGRGGNGGVSGLGGNGGSGGGGGTPGTTLWCATPGSKGGEGGSGGPGGGGAGGNGGVSYAVYVTGQGTLNLAGWKTANTAQADGEVGTGGAGGGAAPGGSAGAAGSAGASGAWSF